MGKQIKSFVASAGNNKTSGRAKIDSGADQTIIRLLDYSKPHKEVLSGDEVWPFEWTRANPTTAERKKLRAKLNCNRK